MNSELLFLLGDNAEKEAQWYPGDTLPSLLPREAWKCRILAKNQTQGRNCTSYFNRKKFNMQNCTFEIKELKFLKMNINVSERSSLPVVLASGVCLSFRKT